jgi:23S rRNA (cytidine1920-2'-O)/16S rRNA (cytidine1409-2'-O)-methyltransferase
MASEKKRLDEVVVDRGWSESRSQARALIMAGKIWQGTERMTKPGVRVPVDIDLHLERAPRFVGRGGEKLEAFVDHFGLEIEGLNVLDVGASTGGFTDCLLQRSAESATCIDVGRAQLHPRIASDPRVTNLERINARNLKLGDLPFDAYDLIVIDVSFISLRKVLRPVWSFLKPGGLLIALVKPQFEAGRDEVSKGRGVIRDEAVRQRVFSEVQSHALADLVDCVFFGELPSPISGSDGNQERLLGLRRGTGSDSTD